MNFINSMIGDNAEDEPSTLLDLAIAVVAVQGCMAIGYFLARFA